VGNIDQGDLDPLTGGKKPLGGVKRGKSQFVQKGSQKNGQKKALKSGQRGRSNRVKSGLGGERQLGGNGILGLHVGKRENR